MGIMGILKEKFACVINMTKADAGKVLVCNSNGVFELKPIEKTTSKTEKKADV